MYPAIMAENHFPYQLIDHIEYPDLKLIAGYVKDFCVVAHICVDTDQPCYAVRGETKILFPTGRFRCYVTTCGLRYALEHGHLVQVYEIAVYRKAKLFTDYVNYFYPLKVSAKQSGDTVTGAMVKIFLNSLYGKFGQRYTITTIEEDSDGPEYFRIDTFDLETGEFENKTYMFGSVITEKGHTNGKDSLIAIAAHVTELGRFILWDKIRPGTDGGVLYCDTDSVFVDRKLFDGGSIDIDSSRLGAWSIDKTVKRLIIHGCKDYEADGETKIKGVPKKAVKTAEGEYVYDQFSGQSTHLRQGESQRFIIREIKKTVKRVYDKGQVMSDGTVKSWWMVDRVLYYPEHPFGAVE